jgi:CheY-like chemotaxis protein
MSHIMFVYTGRGTVEQLIKQVRQNGHEVTSFSSLERGYDYFSENKPVDLIVTDIPIYPMKNQTGKVNSALYGDDAGIRFYQAVNDGKPQDKKIPFLFATGLNPEKVRDNIETLDDYQTLKLALTQGLANILPKYEFRNIHRFIKESTLKNTL